MFHVKHRTENALNPHGFFIVRTRSKFDNLSGNGASHERTSVRVLQSKSSRKTGRRLLHPCYCESPQHGLGKCLCGSNGSRIGEAGAKSYLVAPNNTVQLWDSESQTIYLKSADVSGMPSMRVLDYTIRDATPPATQKIMESRHEYAEKEYVDSLSAEIARLRAEIEAFKAPKGKSSKDGEKA